MSSRSLRRSGTPVAVCEPQPNSALRLTVPLAGRPALIVVPVRLRHVHGGDGDLAPTTPAPMRIGMPGASLTTITPVAPAFCACSALNANSHVPRSTTAIAPAGNPTSGSHASVGDTPAPSFACTMLPDRPAAGGPNCAPFASYVPAAEPEAIVTRFGRPSRPNLGDQLGIARVADVEDVQTLDSQTPTSWPSHDDVAPGRRVPGADEDVVPDDHVTLVALRRPGRAVGVVDDLLRLLGVRDVDDPEPLVRALEGPLARRRGPSCRCRRPARRSRA